MQSTQSSNTKQLDEVSRKYKDNTSMTNLSRYKRNWRVLDSEGDLYQETHDFVDIPRRPTDILHQVEAGEENRLDLISSRYYGSPLYWWVIAQASDIYNPMIVPTGTILRVPSKQSLFGNKGLLV